MQRWNGWGDETVHVDVPIQGRNLLRELIGEGNAKADYPLETFISRIPPSRLPRHALISTDPKERLDHSHGQSLPDWIGMRRGIIQRFPDGVAFPVTPEDVRELLEFSKKHNIIIIPFGGGTSVVGHLQVPEDSRPVLSLSLKRLNRFIHLDPVSLLATFESGVMGRDLEAQLKARGYTLGHFPQSFEFSSLGGWVATRSSGQQSAYYGRIDQLFIGGELAAPTGVLKILPFPASSAGPDLRHIILGSEGRLGVLTKVTIRISHIPEKDELYGIFFPSWDLAKDAVRAVAGSGIPISMVRLSTPPETVANLAMAGNEKKTAMLKRYLLFRGIVEKEACMCLVGFTGTERLVKTARKEVFSIVKQHGGVTVGKAMGNAWKKNRFKAPYLRNTLWDMGYAVDTLETSVTWDKVTPTLTATETAIKESMGSWNEAALVFSHLSHVYPIGSSIYTTFIFRLADTPEETLTRWKAAKKAASQTIVQAGGTISHQHGVGVDHKPYLPSEKGPVGMSILDQICVRVDPENRMNPHKLLD